MGVGLSHLSTTTVNITKRNALEFDQAVDLTVRNPNVALYRGYNLQRMLQMADLQHLDWSRDSDLIVQFVWMPMLHFPVGYVLSPEECKHWRVIAKCTKCDLQEMDWEDFSIIHGDVVDEYKISDFPTQFAELEVKMKPYQARVLAVEDKVRVATDQLTAAKVELEAVKAEISIELRGMEKEINTITSELNDKMDALPDIDPLTEDVPTPLSLSTINAAFNRIFHR